MDRLDGINLIAVLIDAYENQEFSGRLMHPWSAEAIPFASCMELMTKMEALYDAWDYPEAAQGMRLFNRHRSDAAPREFVSEKRLPELWREQRPRDGCLILYTTDAAAGVYRADREGSRSSRSTNQIRAQS